MFCSLKINLIKSVLAVVALLFTNPYKWIQFSSLISNKTGKSSNQFSRSFSFPAIFIASSSISLGRFCSLFFKDVGCMGTLWSSGSESVSVLSPNCELALSSSFSFRGLFSKYLRYIAKVTRYIAGVSRKFAFIRTSFAFIRECYALIRYKYFFYIQKLAFSIRFILELMITLLLIVKLKIYNFTIYSDLFFTISRWSAWKIYLPNYSIM